MMEHLISLDQAIAEVSNESSRCIKLSILWEFSCLLDGSETDRYLNSKTLSFSFVDLDLWMKTRGNART